MADLISPLSHVLCSREAAPEIGLSSWDCDPEKNRAVGKCPVREGFLARRAIRTTAVDSTVSIDFTVSSIAELDQATRSLIAMSEK
jgi:hypothetical protein